MVLMTMREKDGFDFALVLQQICNVGNDDVNAEEFLVWKHDAGINDDDGSVRPECHHVHAEFAEPAQRNDFESYHSF